MARFATPSNELTMARATPPLPPPRDAGDAACGPGWYEASRDLRCGLDVREGLPNDATPGEWLGACLLC